MALRNSSIQNFRTAGVRRRRRPDDDDDQTTTTTTATTRRRRRRLVVVVVWSSSSSGRRRRRWPLARLHHFRYHLRTSLTCLTEVKIVVPAIKDAKSVLPVAQEALSPAREFVVNSCLGNEVTKLLAFMRLMLFRR